MRKSTTLAVTTIFALAITLSSVNRAEAHRGWGWGVGAGIATALILGGLYQHRYYGYRYGYYRPRYYGYYGRPYYSYGYYRPRWRHRAYSPRYYGHRYWRRHW